MVYPSKEELELWMKKIGTAEYSALNICEQVVRSYQSRVEHWERAWERGTTEYPFPNSSINDADRKALEQAIVTLQDLLGYQVLYRQQPQPRSLEDALRSVGVEDKAAIDKEVQRAKEYLQTAYGIENKALALDEKWIEYTHKALSAKSRIEKLTEEERQLLNDLTDTLVDH